MIESERIESIYVADMERASKVTNDIAVTIGRILFHKNDVREFELSLITDAINHLNEALESLSILEDENKKIESG